MRYHYNKKMDMLICISIICFTLAVYWDIKDFEFIEQFDDNLYVTENFDVLRGIDKNSIQRAFRFTEQGDPNYWKPLTYLSHMTDVGLFGLNPAGHHFSSLFFHVVNAILLFILLNKFTGHKWRSAFVAILFAIHPLNADSVAWIAERKSVLSTLFWFSGILLYGHYVRRPSVLRYISMMLCMIMGLLAKPLLVTMPFLLLLLDIWPLRRIIIGPHFTGKRLINLFVEKIPLFLLSGIWVYLSSLSMSRLGVVIETNRVSMGLRLANALVSYVNYFSNILWPFDLAVFYPYPAKMFPAWQTAGSLVVLSAVSLLAVLWLKKRPWLFVGWFWFLGTLFPSIGLLQNGLWPAMADRWMYVPIVGGLIIIFWGAAELLAQLTKRKIAVLLSILFILFGVIAKKQIGYYVNAETLFTHALDVTVNNIVVHTNLASAYIQADKPDKALPHYKTILKARPSWYKSYVMLGHCYLKMDKVDEAIQHLEKALELNPKSESALKELGRCYLKKNNATKAAELFEKALEIKPDLDDVRIDLAIIMEGKGLTKKAIEHYNKSIQLNKNAYGAYNNLGLLFLSRNNYQKAIDCFLKAIEINKFSTKAYINLGSVFETIGNLDEAEQYYKRAIDINPDKADAYNNLGALLVKKDGKIDEAKELFSKALQIDPKYVEAHNNLGLALENQKRFTAAMDHFREAISINPENVETHNNMGILFFKMKQYQNAVHHLQTALTLAPHRQDIRHNLNIVKRKAASATMHLNSAIQH